MLSYRVDLHTSSNVLWDNLNLISVSLVAHLPARGGFKCSVTLFTSSLTQHTPVLWISKWSQLIRKRYLPDWLGPSILVTPSLIVLKDAQRRGTGSACALGARSLRAAFPLLLPPSPGWVSYSLRICCELGDVLLKPTCALGLPPILQLQVSQCSCKLCKNNSPTLFGLNDMSLCVP